MKNKWNLNENYLTKPFNLLTEIVCFFPFLDTFICRYYGT